MILCEDTYGRGFFKALTNRMKKELLVPNMHISVDRFYGACNPKMERQIVARAYLRGFSFFIVVADADGHPKEQLEKRIECHIPKELKDSTHTVILKYEIEDWLCISQGICIDDKPSVILKQREGYEKYRLKDYVPKLDFKRLLEECKSFCKFIECFNACCTS